MEDFRSKSCSSSGDGGMQIESYNNYNYNSNKFNSSSNPTGLQDLRCYSASYATTTTTASSYGDTHGNNGSHLEYYVPKEPKFKKGKSTNGSASRSWSFSDPELQRKKRVAGYKVYSVEGKVKGSFRKSFRWIKDRYTQVVYGWR